MFMTWSNTKNLYSYKINKLTGKTAIVWGKSGAPRCLFYADCGIV